MLKCERFSTGKTRAEGYVVLRWEKNRDCILYWQTVIKMVNVVFAAWIYEKRIVLEMRRQYWMSSCQLMSNVVPKVSPKHNIVILSYISYKLCEIVKNLVNCWISIEKNKRYWSAVAGVGKKIIVTSYLQPLFLSNHWEASFCQPMGNDKKSVKIRFGVTDIGEESKHSQMYENIILQNLRGYFCSWLIP